MAKDLASRKCSHCGQNGHNSRTCNENTCIKLFGVKIDKPDENSIEKIKPIRRTKSAGSLTSFAAEPTVVAAPAYHTDADDRRKGKLWTEDEHRSFLTGLEKLGKGDWRGISKGFVPTRTSTQVASHAQKYFARIATFDKKKRRSSVFDININEMNADSTSPEEHLYQESNSESLSMLPPSTQAMIPFENLAYKKSVETTTHVVSSSARPPLSPSMRYNGGFNYPTMPYMIGPLMNSPAPPSNSIYLPSGYNAKCALPLMEVPHSGSGAVPHRADPPPATAISMNKTDGLGLSLGSLRL